MQISKLSADSVGYLIPWMCHSTLIKKDTILNSGILDYREKWNCDFEWLYTVFLHKIKNLKKCEDAIFLWRQHENQVSHAQGVNMKEDNKHVKEQRELIGYSFDETMEDSKFVMDNVNLEEIKNLGEKIKMGLGLDWPFLDAQQSKFTLDLYNETMNLNDTYFKMPVPTNV